MKPSKIIGAFVDDRSNALSIKQPIVSEHQKIKALMQTRKHHRQTTSILDWICKKRMWGCWAPLKPALEYNWSKTVRESRRHLKTWHHFILNIKQLAQSQHISLSKWMNNKRFSWPAGKSSRQLVFTWRMVIKPVCVCLSHLLVLHHSSFDVYTSSYWKSSSSHITQTHTPV